MKLILLSAAILVFCGATRAETVIEKSLRLGDESVAAMKVMREMKFRMETLGAAVDRLEEMEGLSAADRGILKGALLSAMDSHSELLDLHTARHGKLEAELRAMAALMESGKVEMSLAEGSAALEKIEGQARQMGAKIPSTGAAADPFAITPAEAAARAKAKEAASLARAEARGKIERSRVAVAVRVSQVLDGGALLGYGTGPGAAAEEHDEPIYVLGARAGLVDGDNWSAWLYPCGTYQYTTVRGTVKTVRKYAASVELALRELGY